jgi:hypothetical protein
VPLTDDQRAMLRLLAQREEGYEDIAALKGLSVEQVRAEVKAALAQLAAEGEAVAAPPPAPAEPPVAREPKAEAPPAPPPARQSAAAKPRSGAARTPLPAERRRLLVFAGGALGIVAVVLIAIAVLGGDSGSDSAGSEGAPTEVAAGENGKITQAVLKPADGGDASGRALFGRLGKEVVLQVTAEGLEPLADGESYTVWLYRSPKLALRVGSAAVGDSGRLGARFPIPAELLAYVAGGAFDQIYVSRTSDAAYRREVAQAKREKTLPRYSGKTVLGGEITGPVVKAPG